MTYDVQTDTTLQEMSILNPLLKSRIQQRFGGKKFSRQTIYKNGVPLVQVLNFSRGGWAIIDGRDGCSNQILAYGLKDCFDAKNIPSPEVAFWFRMIQDQLSCEKEPMCSFEVSDSDEQPLRSWPIDYSQDYYWVRLPRDSPAVIIDTTSLPHLISTKWGQLTPWNYLCHDNHYLPFATGCASVAVAQMLYFLHHHIGTPAGLYHTIQPTFTDFGSYWKITSIIRTDYTPLSERWNEMALYKGNGSRTLGTDYVGSLMVDIGERLNTKYRIQSSSVHDLGTGIFSEFGIACNKRSPFNPDTVFTYLNKAQPVIIVGYDFDDSGHAWIIDGYQVETETTYQNSYQWVLVPPDSLCYYPNLDYDYVLTEQQKQWLYPNLQENDYEYENFMNQHDDVFLRMNWGYDGYLDDGLYKLLGNYGWASSTDTLGLGYNTFTIVNYRQQ